MLPSHSGERVVGQHNRQYPFVDGVSHRPHMNAMDVTRRKFLQSTTAGAALISLPGGVISSGAAAGGEGLYAVVSKHATWGIYETLEQARREATLIRKTGFMSTNAVQCSPDLARQFQIGKLGRFIEVDGWALTPEEVEIRGRDVLREARHSESARQQILEYHLEQARTWFETFEAMRTDTRWYACDSDGTLLGVFDRMDALPEQAIGRRCTPALAAEFERYPRGEGDQPDYFDRAPVHCLAREHQVRMGRDVIYRLAFDGASERHAGDALIGPMAERFVVVARRARWIFGAGQDREEALAMAEPVMPYLDDELLVAPASQALARLVVANGYEIPAFWQVKDGKLDIV